MRAAGDVESGMHGGGGGEPQRDDAGQADDAGLAPAHANPSGKGDAGGDPDRGADRVDDEEDRGSRATKTSSSKTSCFARMSCAIAGNVG